MSRARDVIARAVAIARGDDPAARNWAALSGRDRDTAELGLRRVLAAGFRIVGPEDRVIGKGELDEIVTASEPFTDFADHIDDERDLPDDCGIYAFKAGDFRRLRAAIRNLERKA